MITRLAGEADLPAICELSNWAILHTGANFNTEAEPVEKWREIWEATHERYPWFVAEVEGAFAGFARAGAYHTRCSYAWTVETSVYVSPARHRRGVGKALYQRLIPTLATQGYATAIGVIAQPNPASEALHASFGFRRVGLFGRVGWKFESWRDVAYWQLLLQPDGRAPGPIRPVCEAVQ